MKKKTIKVYIERGLASMFATAEIGDVMVTARGKNEKELIPEIEDQLQKECGLKQGNYELILRNV